MFGTKTWKIVQRDSGVVKHFIISKLNEKVIVHVQDEGKCPLQDRQGRVCLSG